MSDDEDRLLACLAVLQASDAGADAALHVVLATDRPNRFKLLTVLCERGDPLVRVYQTAMGPVYVAEKGQTARGKHRSRQIAAIGRLDSLDAVSARGFDTARLQVPASCRHRSADIPLTWLRQQVLAGRRRTVLAASDAVVTSHV